MSYHDDALKKIKELVEQYGDGGYIFRGTTTIHSDEKEGEIYDGINSTLYRWVVKEKKKGEMARDQKTLKRIFSENEKFFPAKMEREIVENAGKMYPSQTEAHEILTDLQHFGGKTNMIDFSRNIHIALFFACQGEFKLPGELIALHEGKLKRVDKIDYNKRPEKGALEIIDPAGGQSSRQRANFQGSIFVRPADGYININPDFCKITPIPADYKKPLLEYLRTFHNITADTVYNDLHGFIKNEDNNETSSLYFYMGIASKSKGEYENAIKYYGKCIERNPSSRAAHNNRGNIYKDQKKYDLAIEDYDKAISLSPRHARAYYNRGCAYMSIYWANEESIDALAKAVDDFEAAVYFKDDHAEAHLKLGDARVEYGMADLAIEDYEYALKLKKDWPEAYKGLGDAYASQGEYAQAVAKYGQAIKHKSDFVEAYVGRGKAFSSWHTEQTDNIKSEQGKIDSAIKDFGTAIKIKPDYADAYVHRAWAKKKIGDPKGWEEDGLKWLNLEENKRTAEKNIAKVLGLMPQEDDTQEEG